MREGNPEIRSSMNYISSADGTSKTMLLSESAVTWYYAYDGVMRRQTSSRAIRPVAESSRTPHRSRTHRTSSVSYGRIRRKHLSESTVTRITISSPLPRIWRQFAETGTGNPALYESYGFPSSNHPNGVNVAFCGGSVDFMAENVEPRVYAQLMTSNSKRSSLVINNVPDRKAPAAVRLGVLSAVMSSRRR